MKISSVSQMRSLDSRAIEEFGIEAKLLMENAGHAPYCALRKEFFILVRDFATWIRVGVSIFLFEALQDALIQVKHGKLEQPNAVIQIVE